jgi:ring-1,2-phenylacetyl-CoA epoxidase subunit PaaC
MTPERRNALAAKLLALADDELILGHRHSEWAGHGPILEEDIAFANLALDEMGHATLWYEAYQELTGEEPNKIVFFRDAAGFRNVQMVELPNGDWAFSMLRQYLFDTAEMVQLSRLVESSYEPIAAAAAKIRLEELYHLRHTSQWVKRLGLGTEESNGRMQRALNELWPYAQQLFVPLPDESLLIEAGMVRETAELYQQWLPTVRDHLTNAGLTIPHADRPSTTSRTEHTSHLTALLAEMQMVARLDPQAKW